MKKIVRLRQLTLSRYKRIYRVGASGRYRSQPSRTGQYEADVSGADTPEAKIDALHLHPLTSFVIDERNIRQKARARNFLWWLVPTGTAYQS